MEINIGDLEIFINKIEGFEQKNYKFQIDYFVYFLTAEDKAKRANATLVRTCFVKLQLVPYTNIHSYLAFYSKSASGQPPKFIRESNGYILHRIYQEQLKSSLNHKPFKEKVNNDLRSLLSLVKNSEENEFLKEAINCFEISAYRASIIMVWNLTIDHIYEYILKHGLQNFNLILSKNTDKRIKIIAVRTKDDFSEIPEGKLIEFCRSANIISNDIRKILDTKLGIRNTYAHPSNVKMMENKAIEFIEDLINNVVVKFTL